MQRFTPTYFSWSDRAFRYLWILLSFLSGFLAVQIDVLYVPYRGMNLPQQIMILPHANCDWGGVGVGVS